MSAEQFSSSLNISPVPHPLDVSTPPSPTTDPDLSSPRSSRPLHKTVHNVRSSSRTHSPTPSLSGRTSPTRPPSSFSLRGDSSPPRPSYSSGNRGTYYGSYNRSPSGTPAGSPHDTPQETPFGSPMISPNASHENLRNIFSNAVVFGDNSLPSTPSPQSPLSNQPLSHHTRALDNQFNLVEDRPGYFSMTVFETTGKRDETKPTRRRKSDEAAGKRRSSSERTDRRKSGEDAGRRKRSGGGDLDPRRRSGDVSPKRRGTAESVVSKRQSGGVELFDPRRRSGGGDISPKRRSTAGESIGIGGRQRSNGIDESQIEAARNTVNKGLTEKEKDLTDLDRETSSNKEVSTSQVEHIGDNTIENKVTENKFTSLKGHSSTTRTRVTSTTSKHSDMSASASRGGFVLGQLFVKPVEADENTSPDGDESNQAAIKVGKHVTMAPTPRVSISQQPFQNYAPSNSSDDTKTPTFIQSIKNFLKSKLPKRVRRRIHKSVLSYVIASLFCFIPAMKPIAGPSPFLIITGGIVFLHPARTVGAQIEITFMSLLAVLLSSLWCLAAIYANTIFNQIYLPEGNKAGRAILMAFLLVGVFTVTLIRTMFPRFFFFGIISCIVMIFSMQRAVDATSFAFNMVSDYSIPIILGAVVPLFVNFVLWPESASQGLARALDDSLRNLGEVLDLTTNAFVLDPENAEQAPNEVIETASDRMRTSIAKMVTAYQESRLEISYAYVPPLDFKDVKKSIVNLSQQLASLGLSLTNERFLLEEARKSSIDSGDTAVGEHDVHKKTLELAAKKVEMLQKERTRSKKGRNSRKGTAESSEYTTVESVKSFLSLRFRHDSSDDEDEKKQEKEEASNEEENQITTRSIASMFSLHRLWTSGSGTPSASNPITPIDPSPKVPKEIGFGDRDLLISYLDCVRNPLLDLSECCERTLSIIAEELEEELDIESEDRKKRLKKAKKDKTRSWFKRNSEDIEKGKNVNSTKNPRPKKGRPLSIHVDHAGMLQEAIETFDRREVEQLQTLRDKHNFDPEFDLGHREELFLVFFFMFSLREVATELQKLAQAVKVVRENNGLEFDGSSSNFGRRKRFFFPQIGLMKWITSDADHTVARDRGHQSLAYLTKTTQEEPAPIAVEWDLEPEIHRTISNTSRRKSVVFINPSDGLLSRRKSTPYVNSADQFSRRKSAPFIHTVDPFSRRKSAPYITTDPFARRRSAPYVNQMGSLTRRKSGPFVNHDGSSSRRKSTPYVRPEDLPSRRKSTPFVKPEDLPSRRKSTPSVIAEEPVQLESDAQSEISAIQRSEISARDEEEGSIYSINSFDIITRIPFSLRLRYQLWRWMHSLKAPEFKYAVKVALAIAVLESPSFFDTTKAEYANIRGVWSCICILLVLTPTAGGTLKEGLLRLGGTILGALWGYIALSIAVNTYVVFAMELIISYPFWYIFLATPYTKVGTVCLLTYIVVVFNAYGTNTEPVFELAWKRTAMNMVGVVVALVFNWTVWPFVARHELRKNVAIQVQSLGELYSSILGTYFYFDPKVPPSQADNDSFAHRERGLQSQIQVCKELLKLTNHEPRLKGPFPVTVYDCIMKSMQNLLDRLISLRMAASQISPSIQEELRQQIHVYRRDLVAAVMLYFHVVSTSLKSKSPLPTYLPSARIARIRLINQLRASMPVMPLTGGAGLEYRNMYWYAYMSLVEEIIEELENIGSLVRLITRESVGVPDGLLAHRYMPVKANDDDDNDDDESAGSVLHSDEDDDGIRGYYEDEPVRKQSVGGAPLYMTGRKFSVSSATHPTARKYSVSSLYATTRKQSIAGPSSLSAVDDKDV